MLRVAWKSYRVVEWSGDYGVVALGMSQWVVMGGGSVESKLRKHFAIQTNSDFPNPNRIVGTAHRTWGIPHAISKKHKISINADGPEFKKRSEREIKEKKNLQIK